MAYQHYLSFFSTLSLVRCIMDYYVVHTFCSTRRSLSRLLVRMHVYPSDKPVRKSNADMVMNQRSLFFFCLFDKPELDYLLQWAWLEEFSVLPWDQYGASAPDQDKCTDQNTCRRLNQYPIEKNLIPNAERENLTNQMHKKVKKMSKLPLHCGYWRWDLL